MFCFSCKYIPQSPVKECVNSISKFHPEEKIVIADSQSEDKSYYDFFCNNKNIDILDNVNFNRVPGALLETYKKYPNEPYYIFLQDSVILKKSLDHYLNSEDQFISFMYFPENAGYEGYDIIVDKISKTRYKVPEYNQQIFGVFGPLFIIKNEMMEKFKTSGLFDILTSSTKSECKAFERIFGICAEQEGFSPEKYNIEGNYMEKHMQVHEDKISHFKKVFLFQVR
jgi:hypothetical protein